jgi:hypothetical protein
MVGKVGVLRLPGLDFAGYIDKAELGLFGKTLLWWRQPAFTALQGPRIQLQIHVDLQVDALLGLR